MTVVDASALLVLLHDEPGAQVVAEALDGAVICAVNLAEVIGKLIDVGIDPSQVVPLLASAGMVVEPVHADDAELVGLLRAIDGGRTLSLGDRCCLALTVRSDPPEVLTADLQWAELDLPIRVRLIR